jgi:hypothetical protein
MLKTLLSHDFTDSNPGWLDTQYTNGWRVPGVPVTTCNHNTKITLMYHIFF